MGPPTDHACSLTTEREPDDSVLWHELMQDNLAALEVLYDRYAGLAMGLAYGMLNDRQSAEDVVQDSFLQVWRRAGTYDPRRGPLRYWLLAIVRHRCIDIIRQRAKRPRTEAWTADTAASQEPADTWTEVEQRLTRATLRRALLHLPPEQRVAIELSYFHGYTHGQIAERLGLPLGTVKGRLRLGLHRLRTLLEALDGSRPIASGDVGHAAELSVRRRSMFVPPALSRD